MPPKRTRTQSDDTAPLRPAAKKARTAPNPSKSAPAPTPSQRKTAIVPSRASAAASTGPEDDENVDEEGWSDLDARAAEDFEDDNVDEDAGIRDQTAAQVARGERDPAAQRESREKQKEMKQLRKSKDPVFPLVQALKKQWERLRRSDLPDAERAELMTTMMPAVKGNVRDLIFKHDASRIVQCMVKYGNEAQRLAIATELKGTFLELARSMYGRFITLRFLKYTSAVRSSIIAEFKGAVPKNIKHLIAGYVLESIYTDYCNSKERYHMLQELYHPRFCTFKTEESLAKLIESGQVEKKQVLHNLMTVIRPAVDKGILGDLTLIQRAALDYLSLASESQRAELYESLHPELVAILHTREGAQLTIRALADATAKDRKTIAKAFKDYVMKIANEEYGHWVLLEFLLSCDDTKLTATSIVKELALNKLAEPESKYLRKVVLFALVGASPRHFAPVVLDQLVQAGKKDAWKKHTEVLDALSPALVTAVEPYLLDWLHDPELGVLATEIIVRVRVDDATRTHLVEPVARALREGDRDATLLRHLKSLVQYASNWERNQAKRAASSAAASSAAAESATTATEEEEVDAPVLRREGYTAAGHAAVAAEIKAAAALVAATIVSEAGDATITSLAVGADGAFVALALAEAEATRATVVPLLAKSVANIEAGGAKGAKVLAEVIKKGVVA
ncbi:armadillo-type protein [Blastocladiella britannica]|nr:armadillo-type protein [Blastocladiella britannica]